MSFVKASLVSGLHLVGQETTFNMKFYILEEFAIYLNYVRKLGFEEAPDYDFLRDLFAKVLRQNGDADDGLFDWLLLNGGKGIESGSVCASYSLT